MPSGLPQDIALRIVRPLMRTGLPVKSFQPGRRRHRVMAWSTFATKMLTGGWMPHSSRTSPRHPFPGNSHRVLDMAIGQCTGQSARSDGFALHDSRCLVSRGAADRERLEARGRPGSQEHDFHWPLDEPMLGNGPRRTKPRSAKVFVPSARRKSVGKKPKSLAWSALRIV